MENLEVRKDINVMLWWGGAYGGPNNQVHQVRMYNKHQL